MPSPDHLPAPTGEEPRRGGVASVRWLFVRKSHPGKPRVTFPALDLEPPFVQLPTPLRTGSGRVLGAWACPSAVSAGCALGRPGSREGACPAEVPFGRVEGDVGLVTVPGM